MPFGQEAPAGAVIVVGAGVVGLACARHLQKAGFGVTLVDRDPPASGTSSGNAGSISSGAVVPIALPGMARQVPGWLLDSNGPLAVRWSYLPRALPWLLRWLRAGMAGPARRSSAAMVSLSTTAVEEWHDLLSPAIAQRFLCHNGQLWLTRKTEWSAGDRFGMELRRAAGVAFELLGPEEIRKLEPAVSAAFQRAIYVPGSAHTVDPQAMGEALYEEFRAAGGAFLAREITGIRRSADGRAEALLTREDTIPVDRLVIAAGAFSRSLALALGDRIPLETERGYHCMIPDPGVSLSRPVSDMDRKFFATSMEGGMRLAGTVEIAGLEAPPDMQRARMLWRQGRDLLPDLRSDGEPKLWMGYRPSIPDSLPVLGQAPHAANTHYAFGHGHLGLTQAAITGRIIAALVAGRPAPVDISPFRADRFGLL